MAVEILSARIKYNAVIPILSLNTGWRWIFLQFAECWIMIFKYIVRKFRCITIIFSVNEYLRVRHLKKIKLISELQYVSLNRSTLLDSKSQTFYYCASRKFQKTNDTKKISCTASWAALTTYRKGSILAVTTLTLYVCCLFGILIWNNIMVWK